MSEKTQKFDKMNKKEFHKSKHPIGIGLVNVDQIVVSDKFKHSDDDCMLLSCYVHISE